MGAEVWRQERIVANSMNCKIIKDRIPFIRRLLVIVVLAVPGYASAQGTPGWLASYFADVRSGNFPSAPAQTSRAEQADNVLAALSLYETDTAVVVRGRAHLLLKLAAGSAKEPNLRQEGVRRLIQACKDHDLANAGAALDYLTTFGKEDFTPVAKDSIRSLFKYKTLRFSELAKLVGFLELTDLKEPIRAHAQVGNPQPVRWAALVSLARMNDERAAGEMMTRVRKIAVNDDAIYQLFPDLVYSRHPEAIAYMVEALHSDAKNCVTADAEREVPIPCGYRIIEQLAPIIDKYPVELDESGDVKTKDYAATLLKVREWFNKNKNYKILRDKY